MDISKIDKNFAANGILETDVEWLEIDKPPFSIHGVFFDEETQRYVRMPTETAKTVSEGVAWLNSCTAGGRIRFQTDSPYIALKAIISTYNFMPHMTAVGSHGFALHADGWFCGMYTAEPRDLVHASDDDGKHAVSGIRYLSNEKKDISIYLPLYDGVYKLYIGVKKGSVVESAKPYTYPAPVVFYGSSITQGGCASRPGNDYAGLLCRHLDTDFINLGFSGNGKAEKEMADYLASLPASAYVLDYDHNAPSVEHLKNTHYPLYETIRNAHPTAPILFVTKPDCDYDPNAENRRAIIYETYTRAKANGDNRVWFIDGKTLFGEFDRDACTVDTCHPNDLGFYRMAITIEPTLKEMLENL